MTSNGRKRAFLLILCALGVVTFAALGLWQIERRSWKLDLIARVDARLHAPPVALPPRSAWATLAPQDVEYRRVAVTGTFLHDRETLVGALTVRGPGFWVMTPLRTTAGVILVNRGFVPPESRARGARLAGQTPGVVTVTGLLRLTEPDGRVLRPNEPGAGRWFSRDVAAIARAQRLAGAAPFFIDADAARNAGGLPVGGLTVVAFRNNHLIYALTWFGLAALSLGGLVLVLLPAHNRRRWTSRFSP